MLPSCTALEARGRLQSHQAVDPADAGVGPSVGVLEPLHRVEVATRWLWQPDSVHRCHLPGVPHRQQGGEAWMQAEEAVLGQQ